MLKHHLSLTQCIELIMILLVSINIQMCLIFPVIHSQRYRFRLFLYFIVLSIIPDRIVVSKKMLPQTDLIFDSFFIILVIIDVIFMFKYLSWNRFFFSSYVLCYFRFIINLRWVFKFIKLINKKLITHSRRSRVLSSITCC